MGSDKKLFYLIRPTKKRLTTRQIREKLPIPFALIACKMARSIEDRVSNINLRILI